MEAMNLARIAGLIGRTVLWFSYTSVVLFVGYDMGLDEATAQTRKCAKVEGEVALSSTVDKCIYARAWGAPHWRRKAL